jgi:aminopeptidase-like protein
MVRFLKEAPCTGYQMCERLFGTRIAGNTHNLRFAMSETLAHLVYLERKQEAVSHIKDGIIAYEA